MLFTLLDYFMRQMDHDKTTRNQDDLHRWLSSLGSKRKLFSIQSHNKIAINLLAGRVHKKMPNIMQLFNEVT